MTFVRPWLLLLLLALPLWWWRRRHAGAGATFSDVGIAGAVGRPAWWVHLPVVLRSLALATWIVAAAGPRIGGDRIELKKEGIAIVIVIDISSSMLAEDFAPSNRLEVAKRQAIAFIRGRTSDRIGVVAFAGEALTQVPVTLDYPVVEQAVMDIKIGSLEDGTAIGSGLAVAVNRLRRSPDKSQGDPAAHRRGEQQGADRPAHRRRDGGAYGIKVYTIGVGTEGEAPIPTGRGLGGGFRYEILPVKSTRSCSRRSPPRPAGNTSAPRTARR